MEFWLLVAFVVLSPVLAFYGGHALDDMIWKSGYAREKANRLAGWSWLGTSLIPFTTGTLILVFVWQPSLSQPNFVNKITYFIFGAVHVLVGIIFVFGAANYFRKK